MAKRNAWRERETCAGCGEYNVNCSCEPEELAAPVAVSSPADRLRLGRNLANVQRLQSEFWQALRDLEESLLDITGETFELDGAKDFNDYNIADVLAGHANDGEGL